VELEAKSDVAECIVTRDGALVTVTAHDLVVGDILTLETGKAVPADCLVFQSSDLAVNEVSLTGEPITISKVPIDNAKDEKNPCPFALQSTLIE
jgi:Ca2+-transporting ATPase